MKTLIFEAEDAEETESICPTCPTSAKCTTDFRERYEIPALPAYDAGR